MTYKVFIEIGGRKLAVQVEADSELEAREIKVHKVEVVKEKPNPKTEEISLEHLKSFFGI